MIRALLVSPSPAVIQDVRLATKRLDVEWLGPPFHSESARQADVVISIGDDRTAADQMHKLVGMGVNAPLLHSRWPRVPDPGDVGDMLQLSLASVYGFVVGYSTAMHDVCSWIRAVAHQASAALDIRTLVVGETGTGKELVVRAIHSLGTHRAGPLVAINCGAMPSELVESILFGHARGAFTSAFTTNHGVIAEAAHGVLFLDEIADLPVPAQASFLRVLEHREYHPVGSQEKRQLSAQVVSATNRELAQAIETGTFRSDLYFRIAQIVIRLPPLRERPADVPLLVRYFLRSHDLAEDLIHPEVVEKLCELPWPGNIRELAMVVNRLVVLANVGRSVTPLDVPQLLEQAGATVPVAPTGTLAELRADHDRHIIEAVLRRCGGDTARAARELGITRRAVYDLLRRHKVSLQDLRKRGS